MNPILSDIYSTVLPSAPFVIAAYALVWLALFVYVMIVVRGLKKTEAQIAVLEEAVRAQAQHNGATADDEFSGSFRKNSS